MLRSKRHPRDDRHRGGDIGGRTDWRRRWDAEGDCNEIRRLEQRPDQAVRVSGFKLDMGLGGVFLEDGVLVPSSAVAGRPVEFVFVGEGRAVLDPPDEVERAQMKLFTGSPRLDQRFQEAVFVVALDEAADALAALPPAGDDPRVAGASEILERWRTSPERKLLEVDGRLLRDAVGDPLGRGFFCASLGASGLGNLLWVVDPLANEQLTMGQFVRADLSNVELRRAARRLEREQRRGKLIGREVADLGIWDTWVSASLRDAGGIPTPGTTGVEARHYDLDVSLRGKLLDLEATARIEMDVLVEGLQVVTLELDADMVPTGVTDGKGRELGFVHGSTELTVILEEAAAAGDVITVQVEYAGRSFDRLRSGSYTQRRPLGWYPHAGLVDRATYDVTVRWPKKYQLYGSGKVVDSGVENGRLKWQRRSLEVPSLGFSFEVGDFDVEIGSLGSVEITVAIDRLGQDVSPNLAAEVLDAVKGPLAYFQAIYGPYPLDELVVVSAPRGFSQGLLGFITLSTTGIVDWDMWSALLGFEDRRLLIAHELSHQWWGNQVGWRSYRDQWVSEAMANYSALLYERNRVRGQARDFVGPGPTTGWRSALERITQDGLPLESLGPVVLGARLSSSLGPGAYQAIVYKKGAVVLDMLARLYGEETFIEMLRETVRVASGRVITTDDFLMLLERIGGIDLGWFADQYVYGTGIPEITYDYRIEPLADGRWLVEGEATQRASVVNSFRVTADPEGRLDVLRETAPRLDVTESVLVVPIQIGLWAEQAQPEPPMSDDGPPALFLTGRLVLEGESSPFRLELEQRPEILWLDRYGEVFGRFFAASRWPRQAFYFRGLDLKAAGDVSGAEEALLAASRQPVLAEGEGALGVDLDIDRITWTVDASIHLALAELYLDTRRLDEASQQLDAARETIPRSDRWANDRHILPLEARLGLLSGNSELAFKSLKKALGGRLPMESARAWALYAVAAHLNGPHRDYPLACRGALDRGVDLGPLSCP